MIHREREQAFAQQHVWSHGVLLPCHLPFSFNFPHHIQDADKGKQLALQEEYITLLSHQLHSQQEYYDEQIRRLHAAAADVVRQALLEAPAAGV